jgi:hypothetical protein
MSGSIYRAYSIVYTFERPMESKAMPPRKSPETGTLYRGSDSCQRFYRLHCSSYSAHVQCSSWLKQTIYCLHVKVIKPE